MELDQHWGLDHGAWSVIKHLFPKADVPVVQLSLDYTLSGEAHAALAARLQALRRKGVLIVGSGNIVHNLGMVDFARINDIGYGYDWAAESRATVNRLLLNGDLPALCRPERMGKAMNVAVPTPDHYWPLLYAMGLRQKNEPIALFNDELLAGSLSMTSV